MESEEEIDAPARASEDHRSRASTRSPARPSDAPSVRITIDGYRLRGIAYTLPSKTHTATLTYLALEDRYVELFAAFEASAQATTGVSEAPPWLPHRSASHGCWPAWDSA